MKKACTYLALMVFFPVWMASFGVARAQTLTGTPTQELVPLSLSVNNAPALNLNINAVPFTPEAARNPQTAGTTTGTQESNGTSGTAVAGTSSGTPAESTQEPEPELNLPEPELPVLDLTTGREVSTQETIQQCVSAADEGACLDPAKAEETILPPVLGNQVKISLLVFLGGALGALLWILSNLFLNSARSRREIMRLERQERLDKSNLRLENLGKAYGAVSVALRDLLATKGNKTQLDTGALSLYKSAAAEIELFGSDETLNAHRNLMGLLATPGSQPVERVEEAKAALLGALRKDLGLAGRPSPGLSQGPSTEPSPDRQRP